jgi:O-antigen/teichoic acid export membrane protein
MSSSSKNTEVDHSLDARSIIVFFLKGAGGMLVSLLGQTKRVTAVVRLRPWDVTAPEGRARERLRRLILTALAGAAAKAISLACLLISIPLALHYLGAERYGLWMAIMSVVAMMGFADLGIGNGLMNAIAEAHGRDDRMAACRYVSSGFLVLTGLAVALVVFFAMAYPLVNWGFLFNVTSAQAVGESGPATAVLIGCFALSMPLGVVQRVQLGYQEGFQSNLWQCGGSVLGLVVLVAFIHSGLGLPWLVLAMAGAPAAVLLANNLVYFGAQRACLRPRWELRSLAAAGKVFRLGLMFFALQITAALVYSSDNFVAAHVLGMPSVVEYSIAQRLFAPLPLVAALALQPLWPAYGEACARGDSLWIRRALNRSIVASVLVTAPLVLTMLVFQRPLLRALRLGEIELAGPLLAGMGAWSILGTLGNAIAMFLNGANFIRFQVVCALTFAAVALPAKIVCARFMGVSAIIWSTNVTYLVLVLVPYFISIKLYFKESRNVPGGTFPL